MNKEEKAGVISESVKLNGNIVHEKEKIDTQRIITEGGIFKDIGEDDVTLEVEGKVWDDSDSIKIHLSWTKYATSIEHLDKMYEYLLNKLSEYRERAIKQFNVQIQEKFNAGEIDL